MRIKKIIGLLIFIVIIIIVALGLRPWTKNHIYEIVLKLGWKGPFFLVFLHSFQVVAAPVPGQIFPFLMGFLYGIFTGIILSFTGILIGSITGYFLGKILGRYFIRGQKNWGKIEKYREIIKKNAIPSLIILFLFPIPGIPKDLLCFFAGVIEVPPFLFALSVILGRLPGEILWVLAGAGVLKFLSL